MPSFAKPVYLLTLSMTFNDAKIVVERGRPGHRSP